MTVAFAKFDEPHAWLIRGLVEYGWVDSTRAGGHLPPGVFGGMHFGTTIDSEGRQGITLEVPAAVGGQRCVEDGIYQFQAKVHREHSGPLVVVVRCPEANYFQQFPYDPANPTWVAGYVHQALTEYVPQFASWRLAGGEVAWAQRAGIPDVEGEPCSFLLTNFLRERAGANKPLHQGPAEGWWLEGAAPPPAPGAPAHETPVVQANAWSGPVAVEGKGSDPVYLSAQATVATLGAAGAREVTNRQARALTKAPGTTLVVWTAISMVEGVLLLLNALSVVLWYRDQLTVLVMSLLVAVLVLMGGLASILGALTYRRAGGGPLPWLSMVYVALVPGCCLAGLPIAVWAAMVWNKPMVKAARQ